jgi:hypothetical protein
MARALYPLLGSEVTSIMNSAAIRLHGSSVLPFLVAERRSQEGGFQLPRAACAVRSRGGDLRVSQVELTSQRT